MSEDYTTVYGIDELAIQAFEAVGFKHPFPKGLIDTYKKFKMCRDKLTPGRVTPEGYAAITLIALMGDKPTAKKAKAEVNESNSEE